jgi:hypothetical protein
MKIEERNILLERIAIIEKQNISIKIADFFTNKEDFASVSIGRYPIKKFISFFNRAIKQLKDELNSDNFYFYPIQGSAQPIAGINLTNVINDLMNLLNQNNITNLETPLNQLITYEYYFGIWHISKYKIHNISAKELKEKTETIDLLNKRVEQQLELLNKRIAEVESHKKEMSGFIESKLNELNQITNNLAKSNQEVKEISNLLNQSQKDNQQINSYVEQQKEKYTEIKKLFQIEQSIFEEFRKKSGELEDNINKSLTTTDEKLKQSEDQLKFILGKKEDIVRLTGMAADGSLGSKFDERQNKLNKGIRFWRWAVPVITLLAIIYIFIIFYFFKPNPEISIWVLLSISLLKTTPALFVLFWVFRQYVKERNIQEEYAFKSAVAMTITAYSDLLDNRDSTTNTSRQQMILNAIKEVHRSPRILDEKDSSSDGNVAKNVQETLKQILDLVKEIKK